MGEAPPFSLDQFFHPPAKSLTALAMPLPCELMRADEPPDVRSDILVPAPAGLPVAGKTMHAGLEGMSRQHAGAGSFFPLVVILPGAIPAMSGSDERVGLKCPAVPFSPIELAVKLAALAAEVSDKGAEVGGEIYGLDHGLKTRSMGIPLSANRRETI